MTGQKKKRKKKKSEELENATLGGEKERLRLG